MSVGENIWKEGKWVDLWSINHILSGILIVPTLYWFHFSQTQIFIITTVIFFGWETFEWVLGIELLTNQFMDIVTNYIGYAISYYLYFVVKTPLGSLLYWILGSIFLLLELWGYISYRRRSFLSRQYVAQKHSIAESEE